MALRAWNEFWLHEKRNSYMELVLCVYLTKRASFAVGFVQVLFRSFRFRPVLEITGDKMPVMIHM